MDEFTHVLAGLILALFVGHGHPTLFITFLAVFGSVLPDLIGEPLHWYVRYKCGEKFMFTYDDNASKLVKKIKGNPLLVVYDIFHSLFFVIFIFLLPIHYIFSLAYGLHVFFDIFTHSENTWGIMLFYPFSKKRFGVKNDYWQWKIFRGKGQLHFNIITYSLFFLLCFLFKLF